MGTKQNVLTACNPIGLYSLKNSLNEYTDLKVSVFFSARTCKPADLLELWSIKGHPATIPRSLYCRACMNTLMYEDLFCVRDTEQVTTSPSRLHDIRISVTFIQWVHCLRFTLERHLRGQALPVLEVLRRSWAPPALNILIHLFKTITTSHPALPLTVAS